MKKQVYRKDFESGELSAWASYPPCQDTAYDPFLYPGKICPYDDGTCLVAVKYPPWNETQLIGAVKLLDLVLDHDSSISFHYFTKTVESCSHLEVHIPLTSGERLVYTVEEPPVNRWNRVTIGWKDFLASNDVPVSLNHVTMTALAIQIRVPKADPDTPVVVHHASSGRRDTYAMHLTIAGTVRFGVHGEPCAVTVNGKAIEPASLDSDGCGVAIPLAVGASLVEIES